MGTLLDPLQVPSKPNTSGDPGLIGNPISIGAEPVTSTVAFLAMTELPLCEISAFHELTMVCPAGHVQPIAQLFKTDEVLLVTVTLAVNPPDPFVISH